MANLSKIKRDRMLKFLDDLRKLNTSDDESLIAINEIESALTQKKYGLVWEEHDEEVDNKIETGIPVFNECDEKSIECFNNKQCNFLLEGDNLHSLYLLEKTHKERVDLIYIDPPYNTGHEDFQYNDDFINEDDSYRHSKWLSFMNKRLKIAKNLLTNDGLIFISIDDNELYNLKLLCDSIFGEKAYVGTLVWSKKRKGSFLSKKIVSLTEYILVYSKKPFADVNLYGGKADASESQPIVKRTNAISQLTFRANTVSTKLKNGTYKAGNYGEDVNLVTLLNDIVVKNGFITNDFTLEAHFTWSQEFLEKELKKGTTVVINTANLQPRVFRVYGKENFKGFPSLINGVQISGTNEDAYEQLEAIFNEKKIFDYSKPVNLIKTIVDAGTHFKKNAIILDFFAGSGTTGQAVLELNKEDSGNRKFIICTNNEQGICENITYKRLKTIITGNRDDNSKYSEGIPANLLYYKTDFVLRNNEDLSNDLIKHIKEMIQLENHVKIDGKNYLIILNDNDADNLLENWDKIEKPKGIYISREVLLSAEQNKKFNEVTISIIPDYYFNIELKEAGEIW